ncbi:MAG: hypothetical protein ACPLRW_04770 [Moorellales bacterium]
MVGGYDISRLRVCSASLHDLTGLFSAGRRRPRLTFITLSQWAAAFPAEEGPGRVLGAYLMWYAQFRYLVGLLLDLGRRPVLVGLDGTRLRRPFVEVISEADLEGCLTATITPLGGWRADSDLAIFGDPICVSVAVYPPGEAAQAAVAFVWNVGLEEPDALIRAAERWARQKGAERIVRGDAPECGGPVWVDLIPIGPALEVAFPVLIDDKGGSGDGAGCEVIDFEEARRRLAARRDGLAF